MTRIQQATKTPLANTIYIIDLARGMYSFILVRSMKTKGQPSKHVISNPKLKIMLFRDGLSYSPVYLLDTLIGVFAFA